MADATELAQVLISLTGNALKCRRLDAARGPHLGRTGGALLVLCPANDAIGIEKE